MELIMKTIILPIPPTTNHMYERTQTGKTYKTRALHDWEEEAGWEIKRQWKHSTICEPLYCGITVFYDRNRDIDNLKPIPDILEACGIIKNDMLIEHMNIKKFQDKKNPRVEIEVEEL